MQVLIVDDSAVYQKLIRNRLEQWGFTCRCAQSGSQASEVLRQADAPKLVLLDWVLPDIDGLELCRRMREGSRNHYTYVIFLTGKDGLANMLKAMEAGADDYLEKPFDDHQLKAKLIVGQRVLQLQEELVAARDSMHYAATHDSLTGLLNRGEILTFLTRELARAKREHKPVGIALADVDHFKQVNDSFGHLFGDETLKEIGRRLRSHLRVYDGIGRYGGEEFLLVLPDCDSVTALTRTDQLRQCVSAKVITSMGKQTSVTLSIGVAVFEPSHPSDVQSLLNQADAGLYRAKQQGRDRVVHLEHIDKQAVDLTCTTIHSCEGVE
jgi:two-component system, cell cycle response regulator